MYQYSKVQWAMIDKTILFLLFIFFFNLYLNELSSAAILFVFGLNSISKQSLQCKCVTYGYALNSNLFFMCT